MKSSFKLFRIAGIDIGIHYSWIFIFIFFSWSLEEYFHVLYPGWSTATVWICGVISSVAIFVSVLLHEMAHSLVARSRGLPVNSITLFILGGVSNLQEEPKEPGVEFSMAIVGPGTSLVLAVIFWGIASAMSGTLLSYSGITSGTVLTTPVQAVIGYLGVINLFLGAFNLLPGFPLDGGRVLRSLVWHNTGNLDKATNIAAGVGKFFGWGFIIVGVVLVFTVSLFSGIWIAFIGWFLNNAADTSRRELVIRERLGGVKVKDVISPVESVSPSSMVDQLVANIFAKKHERAIPVCNGERVVGIVTISDIREVPQDKWSITPVSQIMTADPLYSVGLNDDLASALKLIAGHDINQVIVKEGEKCAGMLSRADILRYLQFSQELGIRR